jgi:hypothetical protein
MRISIVRLMLLDNQEDRVIPFDFKKGLTNRVNRLLMSLAVRAEDKNMR